MMCWCHGSAGLMYGEDKMRWLGIGNVITFRICGSIRCLVGLAECDLLWHLHPYCFGKDKIRYRLSGRTLLGTRCVIRVSFVSGLVLWLVWCREREYHGVVFSVGGGQRLVVCFVWVY